MAIRMVDDLGAPIVVTAVDLIPETSPSKRFGEVISAGLKPIGLMGLHLWDSLTPTQKLDTFYFGLLVVGNYYLARLLSQQPAPQPARRLSFKSASQAEIQSMKPAKTKPRKPRKTKKPKKGQ